MSRLSLRGAFRAQSRFCFGGVVLHKYDPHVLNRDFGTDGRTKRSSLIGTYQLVSAVTATSSTTVIFVLRRDSCEGKNKKDIAETRKYTDVNTVRKELPTFGATYHEIKSSEFLARQG